MAARRRIFNSVFPVNTAKSLPTPTATPVVGQGSFGESFAASQNGPLDSDDPAAEKIRRQRAWHHATEFLSIPAAAVTYEEACLEDKALRSKWIKSCSRDATAGIALLASEGRDSKALPPKQRDESLLDWYSQEVIRHYVDYQLPILLEVCSYSVVSTSYAHSRLDPGSRPRGGCLGTSS